MGVVHFGGAKPASEARAVGAVGTGGAMDPQILIDQLTLYQPRGEGADYAHHITTCPPPEFSDLPTALG